MCKNTCNTCSQCQEECVCEEQFCEEKFDTSCIVYNFNNPLYSNLLVFLGVSGNTNLTKILEILDQKLALLESNGTGTGGNGKVKVDIDDLNPDYLGDKIEVEEPLDIEITENKTVKITLDETVLLETLLDEAVVLMQTSGCPTTSLCEDCTPEPTTPVISSNLVTVRPNEIATLTSTNCNGTTIWYSAGTYIGQGTSIQSGAGIYTAKCQTVCGLGSFSNTVNITLNNTTYTASRSNNFTRNNCGVNACEEPCTGSTVTFTKTYTSTVSQEAADLLAANDASFASEGQLFANTQGTCSCLQTTLPTFTNVTLNNPTCIAGVPQNNGSIQISGLVNANRISYSTSGFSGLLWSSASTVNTNFYNLTGLSGNNYFIRIFYAPSCFIDVLRTLVTPNCQDIQVEVEQPECADNPGTTVNETAARITMTNLSGIVSYRYCNGTVFTCTNNCNPGDSPLIVGNQVTFTIPAPVANPSETYTIRLYSDTSCNNFVTRQVVIQRPNCCTLSLSNVTIIC